MSKQDQWQEVCESSDLHPLVGVRALVGQAQVALFRVGEALFAISAVDPFSGAAVLSRGLVGDLGGEIVVASPIYKQHFSLATGVCLEDPAVAVATYPVREVNGRIEVGTQANVSPVQSQLAAAG